MKYKGCATAQQQLLLRLAPNILIINHHILRLNH